MTEPMFATWRLHTKVSLVEEKADNLCSNAGTLGPWVSAFSWSSPLLRVSSEGWLSGFCHFTPGGESTALWLQRSCSKRWGNYIAREVFLPVRFSSGAKRRVFRTCSSISPENLVCVLSKTWHLKSWQFQADKHLRFFFFNRCRFLEKAHPAVSGDWFVAFGWSCRVTASLCGGRGEPRRDTSDIALWGRLTHFPQTWVVVETVLRQP